MRAQSARTQRYIDDATVLALWLERRGRLPYTYVQASGETGVPLIRVRLMLNPHFKVRTSYDELLYMRSSHRQIYKRLLQNTYWSGGHMYRNASLYDRFAAVCQALGLRVYVVNLQAMFGGRTVKRVMVARIAETGQTAGTVELKQRGVSALPRQLIYDEESE